MIAIHVFAFKMHNYIQNSSKNESSYFNLKKYNIPLVLASVWQFYHTNTYILNKLCHLKAILKAMYFKNRHGDTLCKNIEKIDHKFNYTHTSLIGLVWIQRCWCVHNCMCIMCIIYCSYCN